MLTSTYKTLVHAQVETVWGLLLDSLENPQGYLPGVEEARVIEKFADGVIRETKRNGIAVRERITADRNKLELLSELLEHPLYTGTVVTRLVPASVQNPMAPLHLEYTLRLERKSFHLEGMVKAEEEMVAAIEKEMEVFKEKAEQIDA